MFTIIGRAVEELKWLDVNKKLHVIVLMFVTKDRSFFQCTSGSLAAHRLVVGNGNLTLVSERLGLAPSEVGHHLQA
jgi:hypothetical protein